MEYNLPLIIFDSECTLCTRFVQGLRLLDTKGKISYASLHEDEVYQKFAFLNKSECNEEIHMVLEDLSVLRGSEVVEYLTKKIPGTSKLTWLIESDSAKKAMSAFYKKINQMRVNKKRGCPTCK